MIEELTVAPAGRVKYTRSYLSKWAGSKMQLMPTLLPLIGQGHKFFEPFAGSGVVSLNVAPNFRRIILNDKMQDLVGLHRTIMSGKFDKEMAEFFAPGSNTAEVYDARRSEFNALKKGQRSFHLLYLLCHSFNGLCRFNQTGGFNVPFGNRAKVEYPVVDIENFRNTLRNKVTLTTQDFGKYMPLANRGDVIYCDPPYVPLNDTSSFSEYTGETFTLDDHRRLVSLASQSKAKVIISNSDCPIVRDLFVEYGARVIEVKVMRKMAADITKRGEVGELIGVFNE